MVKQYLHTIIVTTSFAAAKVDGNWTPGSDITQQLSGRYEPNGGNGFITAADGQKINYDGIVYLPLPQATPAPGAKVEVKNGAEVLLKSTIKRFSAGQLNARVWL